MAALEALLTIRADVQGEGKIGALGKALGGLNDTAGRVSGGLKGLLNSASGLNGAFGMLAGVIGGAGLVAFAKNTIDVADNLRDMSIRTGVSVEMLSKLKTAAEMSGTTIEDVGKALTRTANAIASAPATISTATSAAVANGTAKIKLSLAEQVAAVQQREQQQIAAIKAGAQRQISEVQARERQQINAVRDGQDRAIQAVRDGEQRQVQAVERAADERIRKLEGETDARLREINRRYRQEEKLLNDNFDDRRDRAQQQADDELRIIERRIEREFDLRRQAIQNDKTLSEAAKSQLLQDLQDRQEAELKAVRNQFAERSKLRDREFRDQQEREQQAIEDRKRKEEELQKARTEAERRGIEARAKAQKDALARQAAEREAAIKRDTAAQEALIKAGSAAAIKTIKDNSDALIKSFTDTNKRALDAYAKLGIALRNADGSQRKPGEVFLDFFDALKRLPTDADRAAAVIDVFGNKLGPKLLPLFAMGREEIEKLSATITTDFANAADNLNDKTAKIQASFTQLGAKLGEALLPALNVMADIVTNIANGFAALPGPIQTVIGLGAALLIAWGPIAGLITSTAAAFKVLAALKIAATIAGWLGAVGPFVIGFKALLGGLLAWVGGTFIPALLAFFSGPVGWTVLAIAAVVAMAIAFREPIMQFLGWLAENWRKGLDAVLRFGYDVYIKPWTELFKAIRLIVGNVIGWVQDNWRNGLRVALTFTFDTLIKPWINFGKAIQTIFGNVIKWVSTNWRSLATFVATAFNNVAAAVSRPFVAIGQMVQQVFRNVLIFVVSRINAAANLINNLIRGFNRLPAVPDIPLVPLLSIPAFARGGVVNRPTMAMVGEGGEREYIIPESKMASAAARYLTGARGSDVLSAARMNTASSKATINITTGPILEFNGNQYVKMQDLKRAMQMTTEGLLGKLRTPAARVALGLRN